MSASDETKSPTDGAGTVIADETTKKHTLGMETGTEAIVTTDPILGDEDGVLDHPTPTRLPPHHLPLVPSLLP